MVRSVTVPGPRAEYMDTLRAEAGLLGTPGTGWDVGWAACFLASGRHPSRRVRRPQCHPPDDGPLPARRTRALTAASVPEPDDARRRPPMAHRRCPRRRGRRAHRR
jgi:hypothetical protein